MSKSDAVQNKPTPKQRRANLMLAIGLGLVALLIACWPLYILNKVALSG